MRRLLPAFLILSGLALIGALTFVFKGNAPAPEPTGPTAVGPLPTPAQVLLTLPEIEKGPEGGASSTPLHEEAASLPVPVRYIPPATLNLTGSTLGRQRVPLPDEIVDVHKLYFHLPTLTLFMTASEKKGQRALWKLSPDGSAERVFVAASEGGDIRVDGDSKGTMYVQLNNPSRLYRSDDGFRSWKLVLSDFGMFWGIADDGYGTVYGTTHDWNSAKLYWSPNDGHSWAPLADFQAIFPQYATTYREGDDRYMLRHLHGVIYDRNKNQIVVGTGDIARFAFMSPDRGRTWKMVWDEGFTASVAMSGGFRWLLGPDQLAGHGLAVYDAETETTSEVWNPIRYGYAGYVYSLLNHGGVYYAAFHTEANEVSSIVPKSGVIVSPDGETWYPFLEWGPLTQHARTNVWLADGPDIVYISVNGALYAFKPLERTWFEDKKPFGPEHEVKR